MQSKVLEAESRNKRMAEENNSYVKQLGEERTHSTEYETRVSVEHSFPSRYHFNRPLKRVMFKSSFL